MLAQGMRALGVQPGHVVMVHTRMSAFGHIVGGADTVLMALLDAVGKEGTLMMLTGWDDDTYGLDKWPEEKRRAYLDEMPAFDPLTSSSSSEMGRLPERLRTWPGALRSGHPECSMAALGPHSARLMHPHPDNDAFGHGTPLARLVEMNGQVLVLGAPLETLTLLHHAEAIADAGPKVRVTYHMPVLKEGRRVWCVYHDINSSEGAYNYEPFVPRGADAFEVIASDALHHGVGQRAIIGGATCHLFPARVLVQFAVGWLETRFPTGAQC
jgi:aminoglycoside 3-N-acetyltransferase